MKRRRFLKGLVAAGFGAAMTKGHQRVAALENSVKPDGGDMPETPPDRPAQCKRISKIDAPAGRPDRSSVDNARQTKKPFQLIYEMQLSAERLPILDWLSEGGWCTHISSRPESTDAMLEEVQRRGWRAVVTMLAHPGTRARQWSAWNLPVPDTDEVITRYKRLFGGNFAWEVFTEDDSAGVAFPQTLLREQPKTYAQAKTLFDSYVAEVMQEANRHRDVERWGRPGYASATHALAAQGLDCIMVERANDDVEDLQTGIAFARGAARQFGCKWGIDFSLWWGVISGCVQDLPALYHKRSLYLTYFSGADNVSLEGGDLLYNLEAKKPFALGQTLDEFGRFLRTVGRGEAEAPVAVLLPEGHGWMTPPYWRTTNEAWNYARLPYRQGYRGVDGFFRTAYPGSGYAMDPFPFGRYASDKTPASPFALSCVTPEYAPYPENIFEAEPPLPFGRYADRDAARADVQARHLESSPYRPMGNSRWGDIIDVLTACASKDVLSRYQLVVLLGPVVLDDDLRARLRDYVESGGILLAAAGVLGPADASFCGLCIEPELRAGRAWRWQSEREVYEPFRYCPSKTAAGADVEVLAQASSGEPLAARNRVGKGYVYTCTTPWFEGADAAIAEHAVRLLDNVMEGVQPVAVDGVPVEWLSQRSADEYTVVLANNGEGEWSGTVTVKSLPQGLNDCRELLMGQSVSFSQEKSQVRCSLTIPPYEVRVLQWH